MGLRICPGCSELYSTDEEACPKCGRLFDPGSRWRRPVAVALAVVAIVGASAWLLWPDADFRSLETSVEDQAHAKKYDVAIALLESADHREVRDRHVRWCAERETDLLKLVQAR